MHRVWCRSYVNSAAQSAARLYLKTDNTVNHLFNEDQQMDQNTSPASIEKSIKKLRNSLIGSFLFLVVIVAIFAAQTYAYFWDTAKSTNQITSGYMNIEFLAVQNDAESELNTASIRFVPGTRFNKGFKVVNTGNVPVYIRVKVEKNIIENENNLPDGWEELIICNINPEDSSAAEQSWIYRDGYYYYNSRVNAQDVTSLLFDEIYFSESIGNELANTNLELKLICQSVQVNGNSGDPLTAWGWPSESGN